MKHWLAIVALCGTAATAAEVQAPHWGDALFNVYQGRNFTALTTLMASPIFDLLVGKKQRASH